MGETMNFSLSQNLTRFMGIVLVMMGLVCILGGCNTEQVSEFYYDLDGIYPLPESKLNTVSHYYQFIFTNQDKLAGKIYYKDGKQIWKQIRRKMDSSVVEIKEYYNQNGSIKKRITFYYTSSVPNYAKIEYFYTNSKLRRIWSFSRGGKVNTEDFQLTLDDSTPEHPSGRSHHPGMRVNSTNPPNPSVIAKPGYDNTEPTPEQLDSKNLAELANSLYVDESGPPDSDTDPLENESDTEDPTEPNGTSNTTEDPSESDSESPLNQVQPTDRPIENNNQDDDTGNTGSDTARDDTNHTTPNTTRSSPDSPDSSEATGNAESPSDSPSTSRVNQENEPRVHTPDTYNNT
jgi:hypothetical protein